MGIHENLTPPSETAKFQHSVAYLRPPFMSTIWKKAEQFYHHGSGCKRYSPFLGGNSSSSVRKAFF